MTLSDDVSFARQEFLSLWQTCVCASCLLTLTAASLSLPSELEKSKLKQCIAMLGKQLNTFHTYSIFVDLFLSDFVVGNFVKCNFELLLWGDLHPIKIENLWRRFFLVEHILHLRKCVLVRWQIIDKEEKSRKMYHIYNISTPDIWGDPPPYLFKNWSLHLKVVASVKELNSKWYSPFC